MNRVFADTFFFIALLNPRDKAHPRAVAFSIPLQGELVTTAWVLTELADAMCHTKNRLEFVSTLYDLRLNPQVRIIPPDLALFDEGVKLFESRPDKEWSLTDCISFIVMQREVITAPMAGDPHFEQAGFISLLK